MQLQTARRGEGSLRTVSAMELFVPTQLIFTQFSNGHLSPKPTASRRDRGVSENRGVSEKSLDSLQVDRPFIPG
jgi:hypothetical protein